MSTINNTRVLTAGLLAGLVFNIMDMIWNTTVMAADFQANATRLGLDPAAQQSAAAIVPWVVIDFLLGILVVFVYASMRPRFGPGPKTAITAGLVMFLAVSLVLFGFATGGIFTIGLWAKSTAAALVTTVLGSLAGGRAYKEA
jgi:hypothetical protein